VSEEFKTDSKKVLVYLDSSDFSSIADNEGKDPDIGNIARELEGLSRLSDVYFVFSGIHISEMAPTESQYHNEAYARSRQLVRFCGKNALIPFDELLEREIDCLVNKTKPDFSVIAKDSRWFSWGDQIPTPWNGLDVKNLVDDELKKKGLDRNTRRQVKKQYFQNNSYMKIFMDETFGALEDHGWKEAMLQRYPITDELFEVILAYFRGQVREVVAFEKFLDCIGNPLVLARWFESHADALSPLVRLVREPGEKFLSVIGSEIDQLKRIYNEAKDLGVEKSIPTQRNHWDKLANQTINRVVSVLLKKKGICLEYEISDIERSCPGLTVFIRTAYSSLHGSVGENRRKIKSSDMGDFLHATYAPYMTIFRADSSMAQHVERFSVKYGTKVVSKLKLLPNEINAALGSGQS